MVPKVIYVIYILIFSLLIGMLIMCSPGGKEIETKYDLTVEKICLEGHEYYFVRARNRRAGLAPILQNDGSPKTCTETTVETPGVQE